MADEKPEKKTKTIPLELLRDFWPEEDKPVKFGERFDADVDTALMLIEKGIAKRIERADA